MQLHLVQLDQTKDLINRDRICIRHLQGGVRREGLLLDHRQERPPPRRPGLGLPATMPTSTPCPAARRGVRVADGPKYPHIHSEWNHPSVSSQCMGRGLQRRGHGLPHFDTTLVRVCVRYRPPLCQPLPPAASCPLPAASGQQPGPARSTAVAEQWLRRYCPVPLSCVVRCWSSRARRSSLTTISTRAPSIDAIPFP